MHMQTVTPSAPCRRTRLTKDGVDAWLDKEVLLPGQDWELEIRKAVREGGAILHGEAAPARAFTLDGPNIKHIRAGYRLSQQEREINVALRSP